MFTHFLTLDFLCDIHIIAHNVIKVVRGSHFILSLVFLTVELIS